jgi:predicted nucleic acid-binding protein
MTKKELQEKHGTPEEFEAACQAAYATMFVTWDELVAAVAKYRQEWQDAEG